MATSSCLKVLELYSGIGGMHWALKESGVNFQVSLAVDINTTANRIYKDNFPETQLQCFGIEKLSKKMMNSLCVDAILMSPPCQPFTRKGKQRDCQDIRTKSFLHILELLKQLDTKPGYILVENVKGFEVSQTRKQLLQCLQDCGYYWQEFLLTPLQFGIPNCRLRYYLVAKWKKPFCFTQQEEILTTLPQTNPFDDKNHNGKEQLPSNGKDSEQSTNGAGNVSSPSNSLHKECENQTSSSIHSGDCLNNVSSNQRRGLSVDSQEVTKESVHVEPNSSDNLKTSLQTMPSEMEQTPDYSKRSSQIVVDNSKASNVSECDSTAMSAKIGDKHLEHCAMKTCGTSSVSKKRTFEQAMQPSPRDGFKEECSLKDAGRNMRFCEEEDVYLDKNSSKLLKDYMEGESEENFQDFLLSDKELKMFIIMDIVFPGLRKSTCFTKRYGHYVDAAGSVVQMTTDVQAVQAASALKRELVKSPSRDWSQDQLDIVRKLKLRYFTPREVANLLCFPQQFKLPPDMSKVQLYRVLGNSLNVHVVALLIQLMTCGDTTLALGATQMQSSPNISQDIVNSDSPEQTNLLTQINIARQMSY